MIDRLDHLVLTVRDMARTRDFYVRGLGMREEVFGGGRVELLLPQHGIVERRQGLGYSRRQIQRDGRRLYPVAFADEQLVLHHRAQAPERVRHGGLRHAEPLGGARHAALFHQRDKDRQQVQVVAHQLYCHKNI